MSHLNVSMFFPVVEERDIYSSSGEQQDDINSVLEFVFKKLSNKKDFTVFAFRHAEFSWFFEHLFMCNSP